MSTKGKDLIVTGGGVAAVALLFGAGYKYRGEISDKAKEAAEKLHKIVKRIPKHIKIGFR